jgi:recombining binding protein (suppressor of hairless)
MGALQRFTTLAQGHCLVFVRLPDLQDIIKAVDEDLPKAALGDATPEPERAQDVGEGGPESSDPPEQNTLVQPFVGRSLPLLFIRPCDGVGYHSGRSIVVENLFVQIHLHNGTPSVDPAWLRDAMGGDMGRWTVRVL